MEVPQQASAHPERTLWGVNENEHLSFGPDYEAVCSAHGAWGVCMGFCITKLLGSVWVGGSFPATYLAVTVQKLRHEHLF